MTICRRRLMELRHGVQSGAHLVLGNTLCLALQFARALAKAPGESGEINEARDCSSELKLNGTGSEGKVGLES